MVGTHEKKSKKRSHAALVPDEAPQPSERYHPGTGFKEVRGSMGIDIAGIKSGSKELWLVQLPKPLTTTSLHGMSLDLELSNIPKSNGDCIGSMSSKEGVKFAINEESRHIAQQLFAVVSGEGQGDDDAPLCMLPTSRRITLDRVEEGPLPVPVAQPVTDGPGAGAHTEPQPQAQQLRSPAGQPSTSRKGKSEGDGAPEPEKKKKKDKHQSDGEGAHKEKKKDKKDKKDKDKDRKKA